MKHAKNIIGISIILFIAYFAFTWVASTKEIQSVCNNIRKDQLLADITKRIDNSNYLEYSSFENNNKSYITIHSSSNFGRDTCRIEYSSGRVKSAENIFLD